MADKKKVSVNVAVQDDGGFQIEYCTGLLKKQHNVAETIDSCVEKVTEFLRKELA